MSQLNDQWTDDKRYWLGDPKYGLLEFTIGKNHEPIYGDVVSLRKNSTTCRETWNFLGKIDSIEFLTGENISRTAAEFVVVWQHLNDCYDVKNLTSLIMSGGDPLKLLYFLDYFQVEVKSYFYQEILEYTKLFSLKNTDDAKEIFNIIDSNKKEESSKRIFSITYNYTDDLSEDEETFLFSSINNIDQFHVFHGAVKEYSDYKEFSYNTKIIFDVDPSFPVYYGIYGYTNDEHEAKEKIRLRFLGGLINRKVEEISLKEHAIMIDPPFPTFFDKGKLIETGAKKNEERLQKLIQDRRDNGGLIKEFRDLLHFGTIYLVDYYPDLRHVRISDLDENQVFLGTKFPYNKIVFTDNDQGKLGAKMTLLELGVSEIEANEMIVDAFSIKD